MSQEKEKPKIEVTIRHKEWQRMFLGDLYGLANFVESLIIYFPFLDNDNQQTVFWIFFGVALFGFVIDVAVDNLILGTFFLVALEAVQFALYLYLAESQWMLVLVASAVLYAVQVTLLFALYWWRTNNEPQQNKTGGPQSQAQQQRQQDEEEAAEAEDEDEPPTGCLACFACCCGCCMKHFMSGLITKLLSFVGVTLMGILTLYLSDSSPLHSVWFDMLTMIVIYVGTIATEAGVGHLQQMGEEIDFEKIFKGNSEQQFPGTIKLVVTPYFVYTRKVVEFIQAFGLPAYSLVMFIVSCMEISKENSGEIDLPTYDRNFYIAMIVLGCMEWVGRLCKCCENVMKRKQKQQQQQQEVNGYPVSTTWEQKE